MRRTAQGVVIDFAELSDPGRDPSKQTNEDSSAYAETPLGHLAVLCDGMGGHLSGQEASRAAVDAVVQHVSQATTDSDIPSTLRSAVQAAGHAVFALGEGVPAGARPGSTCVAALIHKSGLSIAHVGDSRCYLLRDASITRLTRDHSVVQELMDAGVLTPQAAAEHPDANQITRALGTHRDVEVELSGPFSLRAHDALLLCSDGLTDMVSDAELRQLVPQSIASGPAVTCQQLVDLANQRGGHDNISIQLVEVIEAPLHQHAPLPTRFEAAGSTLHAQGPGATLHAEPPPTLPHGGAHPVSPTVGATQLLEPVGVPATVSDDSVPHTERAPITLVDEPARPSLLMRRTSGAGRNVVTLSAGLALIILVAIIGWWLFGSHTPAPPAPPEEPLIAPDPSQGHVLELAPQALDAGPETPRRPDQRPSAKPPALRDAAAPADAIAPDASSP
ncbi:MAG: serine/threonine-protein phosphatase [Polyangiaceae bacterium]|nr:serine/threonine-protein phosphatase [Polyangiaceae bacterium]MCB9609284.1 serine/threonine-protein phosphatase [Polyangiaceae bacterium]